MAAAAPSPSPMNLLMLGALGIGVYWFMTRRSGVPAVIYPTPAQNAQAYGDATKVAKYQLLGGLLNKGIDIFKSGGGSSSPYTFDTGGSYGFQPTGYLGLQAASDGLAWNPSGNTSVNDSIYSFSGARL